MSITTTNAPACATNASLFQHHLLEDATSSLSAEGRREQQALIRRAESVCGECPLMAKCLYQAVVEYDVAGYVGGTTQRQRSEIRARLGAKVQPEDFDTLAGVTTPNRQIDHDEVVRLRNANPYESLDNIARRLGCSLSTVKRHLRRARANETTAAPEAPTLRSVAPSVEQVLHAYRTVTQRGTRPERKAA